MWLCRHAAQSDAACCQLYATGNGIASDASQPSWVSSRVSRCAQFWSSVVACCGSSCLGPALGACCGCRASHVALCDGRVVLARVRCRFVLQLAYSACCFPAAAAAGAAALAACAASASSPCMLLLLLCVCGARARMASAVSACLLVSWTLVCRASACLLCGCCFGTLLTFDKQPLLSSGQKKA